jgi:hypothetical protein
MDNLLPIFTLPKLYHEKKINFFEKELNIKFLLKNIIEKKTLNDQMKVIKDNDFLNKQISQHHIDTFKHIIDIKKYIQKIENDKIHYLINCDELNRDIFSVIICGFQMKLDDLIQINLVDDDNIISLDKNDFNEIDIDGTARNNKKPIYFIDNDIETIMTNEIYFSNNYMYLDKHISKYLNLHIISKNKINLILFKDDIRSEYINVQIPYDIQISNKIIRFNYSNNIKKMKHINLL